jgi:hypothetical protein
MNAATTWRQITRYRRTLTHSGRSLGPHRAAGYLGRRHHWITRQPLDRQAFVQHYDTDVLDASLLPMPPVQVHRADRSAVALHP